MIQYQSTPDFYRDYIEHGWLKDQAAKVHKYISRWRGKNGKWYYSYKSKAQEQIAKLRRNIGEDGRLISRAGDIHRTKDGIYTSEDRRNKSGYQYSNHKTSQGYTHSRADFGDIGSRVVKTTKVSSKISRKPKKKGNLTSRGYSNSKSSSNNKATAKKIARREHMDYLKSNSVRNTRYGWKENSNGIIIDKETGKKYTPYRRRRKTNK